MLSCLGKVEGPFAVINADDYYGRCAFSVIYNFLEKAVDDEKYNYAMVGYIIDNTLTENGYVSRGVCTLDQEDFLTGIEERVHIRKAGEGAEYTEDGEKTWISIPKGSIVSMNMWGFTHSFLGELESRFEKFLSEKLEANPLKAEFFLPEAVGNILKEGKGRVKVLRTPDKWYGITYKEDKERVVKAIAKLKRDGLYPEKLWDRDL